MQKTIMAMVVCYTFVAFNLTSVLANIFSQEQIASLLGAAGAEVSALSLQRLQ